MSENINAFVAPNQRRGQGGALGAKPLQIRNLAPPNLSKLAPQLLKMSTSILLKRN